MSKDRHRHEQLVDRLLSGAAAAKYQGQQVVVIGGQVHVLPEDDRESVELIEALERKYPEEIPHLLHVPRPESYVV
jgi:hypothetical protein